MKNYYEILKSSIDDSNYKIYSRFKELAFPLHPDASIRHFEKDKERFLEYCEAYYVLSDKNRKRDYKKIYRNHFHKETVDLDANEIDRILDTFSSDGAKKANEYYHLPFKKFKKELPKKRPLVIEIFLTLLEVIAHILTRT